MKSFTLSSFLTLLGVSVFALSVLATPIIKPNRATTISFSEPTATINLKLHLPFLLTPETDVTVPRSLGRGKSHGAHLSHQLLRRLSKGATWGILGGTIGLVLVFSLIVRGATCR